MPYIIDVTLGTHLIARAAAAALTIFPLGFAAGMPFPLAIKTLGQNDRDMIPWAWCVNSSASVVSAPLALSIAASTDYSTVIMLASVVYLAAGAAFYLYCYFSASPVMGTKLTSRM